MERNKEATPTTPTKLPGESKEGLVKAAKDQLATSKDFTMTAAHRLAWHVARSGLFPQFRGSVEQRTADIFTLFAFAQARQLHPMEAIRRYNVIQGQIAMKADAMLAEFYAAGGRIQWLERNNEKVSARFFPPSDPDSDGVVITWTMEEAKKQGIAIARDGGLKDNYRRHPRQMLSARVISEGVRLVAPEVVLGIYTPEEVSDFEMSPGSVKTVEVKEPPTVPTGPPEVERQEAEVSPEEPTEAPPSARRRGRRPADESIHQKVKDALLDYGVEESQWADFLRDLMGRQRRMNVNFLTHRQCKMILAKLAEMKAEEEEDSEQPQEAEKASESDATPDPTPEPEEEKNAPSVKEEPAEEGPTKDAGPVGLGKASQEALQGLRDIAHGIVSMPDVIRKGFGRYLRERFSSKTEMQRWASAHVGRMITTGGDLTLAEIGYLCEKALEEEW